MRPLRFVALSEDGTHFVLAPDVPEAIDNGERFILALDDRLRAASRGDISRLGQIELEIESQLRPKEIQARIRAGETPDAVAAIAGIRIERVMTYAHPVLQERAQIAQRAQRARVKIDDTNAAAPTLLELIESRLLVGGVDGADIAWDARRLDSGQWEVSSTWHTPEKTITAHWRYDLQNGIAYPGNKDTIALVEPQPRLSAVPTPVDDPSLDEAPTGPIPIVRDEVVADRRDETARKRPRRRPTQGADVGLEQLFLTDELEDAVDPGHRGNAHRRPQLDDEPDLDPEQVQLPETDSLPSQPRRPSVVNGVNGSGVNGSNGDTPTEIDSRHREPADTDDVPRGGDKKPRIPSWDDIVFGVKRRK